MQSSFNESKKFLDCLIYRKEKTEYGENVFFKAFAKYFWLTSKSCLWPTFYHMDFMKR